MKPQEQVFKVAEGVIANTCEKFGSVSKEQLHLDRLRKSGKFWMDNNCIEPEALEAPSSPLDEDVEQITELDTEQPQGTADLRLSDSRVPQLTLSDSTSATQLRLSDSSVPKTITPAQLKLSDSNVQQPSTTTDLILSDSSVTHTSNTTTPEPVDSESSSDVLEHKASTSNYVGGSLSHDTENSDDDDDDDVVVLGTVPRKAAPLILLTDDSHDDVSPSTSSEGVSVMNWNETQDNPKSNETVASPDTRELHVDTQTNVQQTPKTGLHVDVNEGENSTTFNKILSNASKTETPAFTDQMKDRKNEDKVNMNSLDLEKRAAINKILGELWNTDSEFNKMMSEGRSIVPFNSLLRGSAGANNIDHVGGGTKDIKTEPQPSSSGYTAGERSGYGTSGATTSLNPENLQHTSTNNPTGTRPKNRVDENLDATGVRNMNFQTNGIPERRNSDELMEDAHYICSLLPYFTLRDVYRTLMDNVHNPDRRATVLEAYINLAIDRQESVQDDVFQGLWAARKRSSGELIDPHTQVQKKRRTEEQVEAENVVREPAVLAPQYYVPNEVIPAIPSTSTGAFTPVVPRQPERATVPYPGTSELRIEDQLSENWYKEKMEFLSAVVQVDKELLWAQVLSCQSDADVEALMERIMEEQEHVVVIGGGGGDGAAAAAGDAGAAAAAVPPQYLENQPSTSAVQPDAIAGPSNINLVIESVVKGEAAAVAGPSGEEPPEGEDNGSQAADMEEKISTQVKTLSELFADADPDYLQERCVANNGDEAKFQEVVDDLLKRKDYPKIEEYYKRQKRLEMKKKFIEGMSVEEFLEYFEDPEKVFCDTSTNMSNTYIENTRSQLKKDLPFHLIRDIENTLKNNNFHYWPTLKALQENEKLARRKTKRTSNLKERDLDYVFIKELCYVKLEAKIKEHLWKKEKNKRLAFLLAKTANMLNECGCCCDDEILEEDMEPCSGQDTPHLFCVNCIRRFVEEEIGQGRTSFRCLESDCKAEFSLTILKKVMKPSVFSKILERKQLEEIAAAGIEDLVACPFCNFQTIMPNPEDKVFKCLNPECMKDSCRYCKEPNHVPLHCDEVEKQHQKDTRVFLENKMTEAMIRECWKCKKRFIKEDGCNKMVCSCGAMMCYICKQRIKGYDHFDANHNQTDSKKCPLWSNSKVIHAEEVRAAASKLKKELGTSVDLKHNPLQDLPEIPKNLTKRPRVQVRPPPPPPPVRAMYPMQLPAQPQVAFPRLPYVPVAHVVHRNQPPFYLPAQPPPAHLPPAPPAHRQMPPGMQMGMMRPPVMPEANQYHHQHHHHHIHPMRQNIPPLPLPPQPPPRPLRDHAAAIQELFMEGRRNPDMQLRQWNRYMEATTSNINNSGNGGGRSTE